MKPSRSAAARKSPAPGSADSIKKRSANNFLRRFPALRSLLSDFFGIDEGSACRKRIWILALMWAGAAFSVLGLAVLSNSGCDVKSYLAAIHGRNILPYSPIFTKPTIWLAKLLPLWITAAVYGVAYFSGLFGQLWAGMHCASEAERRVLRYVAPAAMFFPGLLVKDIIINGNIAFILYGVILAFAIRGWKENRWGWFYLSVLVATCVKFQMLPLLAIPFLSGKRQEKPVAVVGFSAAALYAVQSWIWPESFQQYLATLGTLANSDRDFGCGLVGSLARLLHSESLPYETPCLILYGFFAVALLFVLYRLYLLYREGRICFESWVPVMLMGVFLLNPRNQDYDLAPLTLPMVVVAWRALRGSDGKIRRGMGIAALVALLGLNVFVEYNEIVSTLPGSWKYTELVILLVIFGAGVRELLQEAGGISLWDSSRAAAVPEGISANMDD